MPNRSLEEWLAVIETRHPNEIDLGLARVGQVWSSLKTQISTLSKPAFITVAGTNGKGSCVATMQAVLSAHGYSVGAFTSPHFLHYSERITINGVPASDAQKKTGEKDALIAMTGTLKSIPVVVCAFEFAFNGGSMGYAVGEKFTRAAQTALEERRPLICFSATGGARMQEVLDFLILLTYFLIDFIETGRFFFLGVNILY